MKRFKHYGLFDKKWYLATYPDVAAANVNPLRHYLNHGWREGRNPSERFDGDAYLKFNMDVAAANICPLVHYVNHGRKEKRHAVDIYGNAINSCRSTGLFKRILFFPIRTYEKYHMLKDEIRNTK